MCASSSSSESWTPPCQVQYLIPGRIPSLALSFLLLMYKGANKKKHSKYSSSCIVRWKSSWGRGGKTSEWDPKLHLVLCSYSWWKEIWLYTLKNSLICHCTQLTNWEFYNVLYIIVVVTQHFNFIKSFPALGSFTMSQLSTSDGQSIGASALASVLPMNISGYVLFPDVASF